MTYWRLVAVRVLVIVTSVVVIGTLEGLIGGAPR